MRLLLRITTYLVFVLIFVSPVFSQSSILVSKGASVTAYLTGMPSSNSNSNIAKLTDGIISASNFFEIRPGNEGSRIVITLADSVVLSRVQMSTNIRTAHDFRLRGYEVRTSLDGVQWTLLASDDNNDTTLVDIDSLQRLASYFELKITKTDTGETPLSTILGEISLWAQLDRPTITWVSVAPRAPSTSEYQTISWISALWDSSKTVSILYGSNQQSASVIGTNVPNTGSYSWRTSLVPDGPTNIYVIPDTAFRYTGGTAATIQNFGSVSASIDIPFTQYYEPTIPMLFSSALNDSISFSWSYTPLFSLYSGQEIRFSSDSGATWVTLLAIADTATRTTVIPASSVAVGGERCFLGVSVLMDGTRMVTVRHKYPFHLATIPETVHRNWSLTSSLLVDFQDPRVLQSRRGMVGYPKPNNHWRIAAGPMWLLDEFGNEVGSWNIPLPQITMFAAGDVDRNGITDIVPGSSYRNSALDYVPSVLSDTSSPPVNYYPVASNIGDFQLIDVDDDDTLEVVSSYYGSISVFRARGEFMRRYSWTASQTTLARFFDIGGSVLPELVVPNGQTITVFDSVGQALPHFPATFATTFAGYPYPFDATGDGVPEILVAGSSDIFCVTFIGTISPGFPVSFQGTLESGPSIGDIDADGNLDFVIVVNRNQSYEVRCYDAQGAMLSGWPRSFPLESTYFTDIYHYGELVQTSIRATPAQPLIASIDGDLSCEILISTANGRLYIFHADGTEFAGSPFMIGNYSGAAGIVGDFDADGAIEYAYPVMQEYPARISVACLEFDPNSFNPRAIPWPMFGADATKSGLANSAVVVGVRDEAGQDLPKEFSLHQNYPNPFNPSTTILYDLPSAVHTTVRVLNVLGQTVATLVDEFQQSGSHTARFNGTGLASGVYFVHVAAGANWSIRKMLLVK